MKWLDNNGGVPEGDGIIKSNMDSVNNALGGPQRTQDDAAVGYVFQRPPDPEFPSFGPKQLRWAQGDDTIMEVKYLFRNCVLIPTNTLYYCRTQTNGSIHLTKEVEILALPQFKARKYQHHLQVEYPLAQHIMEQLYLHHYMT